MSRRFLILAGVFALALAMLGPIGAAGAAQSDAPVLGSDHVPVAESEYGSYIVVMKAEPLVVTEGKDNLDTATAEARGDDLEASHDEALEDAGVSTDEKVQSYVNALNGFSALLSHDEAQQVAAQKDVAFVLPDELYQLETDSSPSYLSLDRRRGPWDSGYTGEGVVVGVIDSGIWPEHPSFADNGSYANPGLSVPCEFGNTAHNSDDVAFTCQNKLVGARQMLATYRMLIGADPDEFDSARDDNGHGTHTASTAAGNGDVEASAYGEHLGTISGIAPRAHVIAYKGLGNLGGFGSDLAAAIDQAVADGVDVINYSVGGGASLIGGDDISFLFAAAAGVYVATSSGNSGPGPGTVGGPGTVPWISTVGASTQKRFFEGAAILSADKPSNGRGWHRHKQPRHEGASITLGTGGNCRSSTPSSLAGISASRALSIPKWLPETSCSAAAAPSLGPPRAWLLRRRAVPA